MKCRDATHLEKKIILAIMSIYFQKIFEKQVLSFDGLTFFDGFYFALKLHCFSPILEIYRRGDFGNDYIEQIIV